MWRFHLMRARSLPFVGAGLLSVLVLFTPGGQVPAGPWWADDLVHAGVFALLTGTGRMLPVRWPAVAVGLVGYAAFSEVVQAVAPLHRSGSVLDVLADLAGIGVALLSISAAHTVHQRTTHRAGERDTRG